MGKLYTMRTPSFTARNVTPPYCNNIETDFLGYIRNRHESTALKQQSTPLHDQVHKTTHVDVDLSGTPNMKPTDPA
ncbi:unnamed protein product [Ectocarpus fasciculatus]